MAEHETDRVVSMFDGVDGAESGSALDAGKLAKVLALADSEQEGEALAAVRAAGGMLAKAGLRFADLLHLPDSPRAAALADDWLQHVALHVIEALQDEVAGYKRDTKELQRRLNRSQRELGRSRREAARWKALAEGADAAAQPDGEPSRPQRRTHAAIRAAVEQVLADPLQTALSDREIARRVGVSNQTVSNHRKRLQGRHRAA